MKDKNRPIDASTHRKIVLLTAIFGLAIGVSGGIVGGYYLNKLPADEQKLVDEYRLLKENWLYGNEEKYLSDYAAAGLAYGIATGTDSDGNSLYDPYTFYTQNYSDQGLSTDHKGFGFNSHSYNGGLYVVEVHPGSESGSSGPSEGKLFVGDVLYGVTRGSESYYDFTLHTQSEISAYLSALQDTTTVYAFNVTRGDKTLTVSLTRGDYSDRLVDVLETPSTENGRTLTVRINLFLGSPTYALKSTLDYYLSQGTVNKLVLDLRGNGGGYIEEAKTMASLFVKKGTLIYELVNKDGKVIAKETQTKDPEYSFPAYSILIDSGTASASEIFTLAMRAGTDAEVIGLKSYGKGIAQFLKTFSDGSTIRYTSAYVYGAERKDETMYEEGKDSDDVLCIHGKGILPDVTYAQDYGFLQTVADYTSSLAPTLSQMNYLLKMMNFVYPDKNYPTAYSSTYHFTDAIQSFALAMSSKYSDPSLLSAFSSEGTVAKKVNDRLVKESFDAYLSEYAKLTEEGREA